MKTFKAIRTRFNNEIVYEGNSWIELMNALTLADEHDEIDLFENGELIWNGEEQSWDELIMRDFREHDGEWTDYFEPSTGANFL